MAGLKCPPDTGAHYLVLVSADNLPGMKGTNRYDCKSNTKGKGPANLKYRTEHSCGYSKGILKIERHGSNSPNSRQHVEEDPSCLRHHLSQDPWSSMLESEFALGHWLRRNHMSTDMLLKDICDTNLKVIGLESVKVMIISRHIEEIMDHVVSSNRQKESSRKDAGDNRK